MAQRRSAQLPAGRGTRSHRRSHGRPSIALPRGNRRRAPGDPLGTIARARAGLRHGARPGHRRWPTACRSRGGVPSNAARSREAAAALGRSLAMRPDDPVTRYRQARLMEARAAGPRSAVALRARDQRRPPLRRRRSPTPRSTPRGSTSGSGPRARDRALSPRAHAICADPRTHARRAERALRAAWIRRDT